MNKHPGFDTYRSFTHKFGILQLGVVFFLFLLLFSSIIVAQPSLMVDPEEFHFQLPHGVGSAGSLNIANNGDSLLIVTVGQRSARRDFVVRLLIWTRYTDEEWELQNLLTSLSALEPEYRYTLYDGIDGEEMFNLLDQSHVLLIPDQENGNEDQVGAAGEIFRDAIQWFVIERGGFVIGSGCNGQTAAFLHEAGLINIEVEDDNLRLECEVVGVHPLNSGVREYLALPCSNIHFCDDADAFAVSRPVEHEGNNITAKEIGDGGVVYLGMDWVQYNVEMTQLLINAVMWYRGGANWLMLEPFEGLIEPNSAEDLFFAVESRIVPTLGNYSQYIVINSNDPDAPEVLVPVEMTVTDWLPAELLVSPEQIFIISEPGRDSSQVLLIRNNGGGVLEANVSLADPNVEWLTLSRHVLYVNPGVMDRVLLDFSAEHAGNRVRENLIIFEYENPDPVRVEIPVIFYAGSDLGSIRGTLIDAENREPVSQAVVNLQGLITTSDEEGVFNFERIPPYLYILKISHLDYLENTVFDVRVTANQEIQIEEQLYYCILESDLDENLEISVFPNNIEPIKGEFENNGNGVFNYQSIFEDRVEIPDLIPWQVRLDVNSLEITAANEIKGAVFDGENLLISAFRGQVQPKMIYFLNRLGELVDSVEQPGEYARGMSDLAWDGELIYGTDWNVILGFNRQGEVQMAIENPPFYYCRAIAWDETNRFFWIADARSDVVAINRDGQEIIRFDNPGLHIYGMGWLNYAEDDYNLYLLCRDGPNHAQVNRMNVETGEIQFIIDLLTNAEERAGGFSITGDWEPRHWTAIAQLTGGENRTLVYNLGKRRNWVRLSPETGLVQPGQSLPVNVIFDARGFHIGDLLEGYLIVDGHQRGGADTISVAMRLVANEAPRENEKPLKLETYSMNVYPNPFNDRITVNYIAPIGTSVEISLFDLQGRLVENLVNEVGVGMKNSISLESQDLVSGLYFIKMTAGNVSQIRRVVLLR